MQGELDDMSKMQMKSFEISDFKVTAAGNDTAVTSYVVKLQASMDSKDISGTYNAGSVWKKEKGGWMAIFHTDMPQAGK